MEDREVEESLRQRLELLPSGLSQATPAEFMALLDGSSQQPSRRGFAVILVAAAAALLLAIVGWLKQRENHTIPPEPAHPATTDVIVTPVAMPPLRLLDILTMSGSPRAVVQDFVALQLASVQPAATIAGMKVAGITDAAMDLVDAGGKMYHITMNSQAAEWETFLQQLAEQFQARIQTRTLTIHDMGHLAQLALLNEKRILEILSVVAADSASPYRMQASQCLSGGQSLTHIQQLIHNSQQGEMKHRVIAIQALGRIASPLARQFLRDCLEQPDHPALLVVLDSIAAAGDLGSLPQLNRLADNESCPVSVRDKARATSQRLAGAGK